MTISTTDRIAGPFNGNDVATNFPFTNFKIIDSDTFEVYHVDSAGIETLLTVATDYTLNVNTDQDNNPGGSIDYPVAGSPLATGEKLYGKRVTQDLQGVKLKNQGAWLPVVVEGALDRSTALIQELKEEIARAVKVTVASGIDPDDLIASIILSEANAAASAQAAADSYDAFDDRYLGSKTADPALDNDGNALLDGALYWNTTANEMRVYDLDSTTWVATYLPGTAYILKAGDTMTGALTLSGDPTANLHAVTKQYVDNSNVNLCHNSAMNRVAVGNVSSISVSSDNHQFTQYPFWYVGVPGYTGGSVSVLTEANQIRVSPSSLTSSLNNKYIIHQYRHDGRKLAGKTVTFSIRLRSNSSTAQQATIKITDGTARSMGANGAKISTGLSEATTTVDLTTSYVRHNVTKTISAGAQYVTIEVESPDCSLYTDDLWMEKPLLNFGSVVPSVINDSDSILDGILWRATCLTFSVGYNTTPWNTILLHAYNATTALLTIRSPMEPGENWSTGSYTIDGTAGTISITTPTGTYTLTSLTATSTIGDFDNGECWYIQASASAGAMTTGENAVVRSSLSSSAEVYSFFKYILG